MDFCKKIGTKIRSFGKVGSNNKVIEFFSSLDGIIFLKVAQMAVM